MNKILPIQYLRAIAALMVVAYHAPATISSFSTSFPLLNAGAYGVDIFFVISGFIMSTTATSRHMAVSEFMIKRMIRIIPLYWGVTLFTVVLALMAPRLFQSTVINIENVIKSLLFIPHYSLAFPSQIWPVVVPGWTLNYEVFFYTVLALCILLMPKARLVTITSIFAALIVTGLMFSGNNALYLAYTDTLLLEFILGMWIAELYRTNRLPARPLAWALVIVGYFLLCIKGNALRGFSKGIPAAAIVYGALVVLQGIKNKPLELLGDSSYAVYLTQYFTFGLVRVLWNMAGIGSVTTLCALLYVVVCLICSAFVGIRVHLLVEKPLTTWLTRKTSHLVYGQ